MHKIMEILPNTIKAHMQDIDMDNLTEIRLRVNQKLRLRYGTKEIEKPYNIELQDITDILKKVSTNSIYSIQNEINNGYITAPGGNRIGLVGEVVIDNSEIKNIKNILSMNVRLCHEVIGCSNCIINTIYKNKEVLNTLIISPPGCGKTTILRDIVRTISNDGKNVGLVDERNEIAAVHKGVATLDVGTRTDIISNVNKPYGINILTRSMGLDVIATDEIGSKEDIQAVVHAMQSGIKVIATAHGGSDNNLPYDLQNLINQGYFDAVIYLSKNIGKIEKVVLKSKFNEELV